MLAKKSHNVINIISGISVTGVAVGSMALIIILSVFNGFESLITSLFNSFDPDIKITATIGKTFDSRNPFLDSVRKIEGVLYYTDVIEENALLRYDDKQYLATLKGVESNYALLSGVDSMIIDGEFILQSGNQPYAVVGQGIAYYLSLNINFTNPIIVYVPRRGEQVTFNAEKAFNKNYLFPSGIFSVEKETDLKYILLPISFTKELLDYENEISAIELKLKKGASLKKVQEKIQEILGSDFNVKNRYEQKEFFYKVMKSEKWAIFFILTFIVIVASFNIMGSLTMLIIDKKQDMYTLRCLGADLSLVRKIFLLEGWMISIVGAVFGLILGGVICWVQQTFGIVRLQGGSAFIIQSYPVAMELTDFIHVFVVVLIIGFIAAWYPVHYITKKHIEAEVGN